MSARSAPLQESIRSALLRTAGAITDAKAVADASISIWQRVIAQLLPIIGDGGFEALYTRCLHLQRVTGHEPEPAHLLAIRINLESRETADALEASVALLDTFTTLLSGLIGEGLTYRLLNPVWADRRTDEPAQENKT